jgi:hypothetical protein
VGITDGQHDGNGVGTGVYPVDRPADLNWLATFAAHFK